MSEVTLTAVNHNGVEYPPDTPVGKIEDLSDEQADQLREAGAIGEPVVPESVKTELDDANAAIAAKDAEIAELQKKLAEASSAKK